MEDVNIGDYVNSVWNEKEIGKIIAIYTPSEWLLESPSDIHPECNVCAVEWLRKELRLGYWCINHLIRVEDNLELWYGNYGRRLHIT